MKSTGRLRIWAKRWVLVLLAITGPLMSGPRQEVVVDNSFKVKAAFLRNFARYVSWPSHGFPSGQLAWHIGVLGRDPFGDELDKTLRDRTEQGHPFKVFRADSLDRLPECQIVFIAYSDPEKRRAALRQLRTQPVLTVADAPEFLNEGGIIRFWVNDHVEMSINLDQARSVSLNIQTKMLEVTREVLENGEIRRMR